MNKNTEFWKNTTTNKHWAGAAMLSVTMLALMPKLPTDASIVELGCGQGRNLFVLETQGYTNAIGVEINRENIAQGKTVDYVGSNYQVIEEDVIDYVQKMEPVDLIITSGFSYLCGDPKIWKYIQEKCKYYLFIEPSQDTHLDSNSDLYKHVDYIAELDKMKVLERINRVNHDQYEAALMVRNET